MHHVYCATCKSDSIHQNDSVLVDGEVMCVGCFEQRFPTREDARNFNVEFRVDDTICATCGHDNGQDALRMLGRKPLCEPCHLAVQERVNPKWLKLFFAGLLACILFTLGANWPYFIAYNEFNKGVDFVNTGDYESAAKSFETAAISTNNGDLRVLTSYYRGLSYMQRGNPAFAVAEFEFCQDKLPKDYDVDALLLDAQIGASFDEEQYDRMLELSVKNYEMNASSIRACSQVASAHACMYAITGDASHKQQSVRHLEIARALIDDEELYHSMLNHVEYRLSTREILTREAFTKRFPNGWANTQ